MTGRQELAAELAESDVVYEKYLGLTECRVTCKPKKNVSLRSRSLWQVSVLLDRIMSEASGRTNLIQASILFEVYEKVLDGLGLHRYIGVADRTHSLRWLQHLAMQSLYVALENLVLRDVW